MLPTHKYRVTTSWTGSTADGPRAYSRTHSTSTTPATSALPVTADVPFRGEAGVHNPEQLLVMAASSCHMLSFLWCAAQAGFDVRSYTDKCVAQMPMKAAGTAITLIELKPVVTVAGFDPSQAAALDELMDQAHRECFIANTLRCEVTHDATYQAG